MELSLMTFMMELPILIEDGGFQLGTEPLPCDKVEKIREMICAAHEAGFRLLDLVGTTVLRVGVEQICEFLERYELKLNCLICTERFANTDIPDEQVIANVKRVIDCAANLGTKKVMLALAPAAGNREDMFHTMVRRFKAAVHYANRYGIICVIEDDPKINIPLCSKKELRAVLEAVPGLRMVFDTANMMLVHENPVENFEALADFIEHIHLKDLQLASSETVMADVSTQGIAYIGAPHGTGIINFRELFDCFQAHDYQGTLAVEYVLDPDKEYRSEFKRIYQVFTAMIKEIE